MAERVPQIDYARMLEVITTSNDPEATLAAFVMREVQVVSAALVAREEQAKIRAGRAEAALKFKTGLIEDISADCERAETALADLRARVKALADEWERDPNLHYHQRYTSDVRRELLEEA